MLTSSAVTMSPGLGRASSPFSEIQPSSTQQEEYKMDMVDLKLHLFSPHQWLLTLRVKHLWWQQSSHRGFLPNASMAPTAPMAIGPLPP